MSQTPSHRRREGRMAFYPEGDPADHDPYARSKAWGAEFKSADWLDGWNEAATAHEARQQEEAEEDVTECRQIYTIVCNGCGFIEEEWLRSQKKYDLPCPRCRRNSWHLSSMLESAT